jgi:hypothetical protein
VPATTTTLETIDFAAISGDTGVILSLTADDTVTPGTPGATI